jgi:hypothetical protein
MKSITLQDAADYLESATITTTHEMGHTIVQVGINEAGSSFVMVNDCFGSTHLKESN